MCDWGGGYDWVFNSCMYMDAYSDWLGVGSQAKKRRLLPRALVAGKSLARPPHQSIGVQRSSLALPWPGGAEYFACV